MAPSIKRISLLSAFLCAALAFSYLEFLLPLQFLIPIPGIRLGLPNLVVLLLWYAFGMRQALCVSLLRVLLQALLFGSTSSYLFSFGGAIASLLILFLFSVRKEIFSCIGVSVLCAAFHQIGQILVAVAWYQTTALLFTYLPWLLLCAMVTGTVIGILTKRILPILIRLQTS